MLSKKNLDDDRRTADEGALDRIFSALSDRTRRDILGMLDGESLVVSEIARRFPISLQAVSRHVHVLVDAGLVTQKRSGRISRCSLNADPILPAAVWINRFAKYWQEQFDELAAWVRHLEPADGTANNEIDGHGKEET